MNRSPRNLVGEVRIVAFLLCFVLLSLPFPSRSIQAAAGDLDPSFGGGKVTTALSNGSDFAYDLTIQADGKVILVGTQHDDDPGEKLAVVRYNTDGTLDASFGNGGKVTTQDAPFSSDVAYAVALQADGKIVAGGSMLVRYNVDGSLDTSFGDGGKVSFHFSFPGCSVYDVGIQPDGKIVTVGATNTGANNFCVMRFTNTGSVDPTFGDNGHVVTSVVPSDDFAQGISLQSDGKIICTGFAYGGVTNQDFATIRYNADGSLDHTFGNAGIVTTSITSGDDSAYEALVQPDGKIIVAGQSFGSQYFAMVRYNPNGSFDTSFGEGGIVTTRSLRQAAFGFAAALQKDGKIVGAGHTQAFGAQSSFLVLRYTSDGDLDPTFGNAGIVITAIESYSIARGIAIAPNGAIVAAGYAYYDATLNDFAVVRYQGDPYDICIQDDGTRNLLRINSTTGEYQFSNCAGFTLGGTGILTKKGNILTLQHSSPDRRVFATIDSSVKKGTGSVRIFPTGQTFSLIDRNTTNNTCACQ